MKKHETRGGIPPILSSSITLPVIAYHYIVMILRRTFHILLARDYYIACNKQNTRNVTCVYRGPVGLT